MHNYGMNAYDQMQSSALDGRALEAQVLLRAARKLAWCAQHWQESDTPQFRTRLTEALDFNQRLWTLFQVELLSPENPLDAGVRGNLIRLSQEVDKRSFALHSGGEVGDLEMLTRLNEAIAGGLQDGSAILEEDSAGSDITSLNLTA